MKKLRSLIMALCCFVASLFFAYVISEYLWKTPPPVKFQLTVFANTEIYEQNKVYPGTFRIELSKEELLKKAALSKEKLVIVHPSSSSPSTEKSFVEYWLPATGSAFYHSTEYLGRNFATIDRIERVNNLLIIYYKNTAFFFLSSLSSLILLIVGVCLVLPLIQKRPQPPTPDKNFMRGSPCRNYE